MKTKRCTLCKEIKAQAVEKATEAMTDMSCGDHDWWYDNFLQEYAENLRQQNKEQ